MMPDIVDELRTAAMPWMLGNLESRAADEIERLRGEVAELKGLLEEESEKRNSMASSGDVESY